MKRVYTLNINNYFPELMDITIPKMKEYSEKIGAEFIEIKERKFPEYHIHYEKLQIYELGKEYDWNIFFDGDVLINPNMEDITEYNPYIVYLKDGYRADIKFVGCDVIKNDTRNIGISSCFLATSKYCHNMWKPVNMSPNEITSKIITSEENMNIGITSEFYQEEYVLSYNLAKYKYSFSGVKEKSMYHSYKSNLKEEKLNEIRDLKW